MASWVTGAASRVTDTNRRSYFSGDPFAVKSRVYQPSGVNNQLLESCTQWVALWFTAGLVTCRQNLGCFLVIDGAFRLVKRRRLVGFGVDAWPARISCPH
jgi:hypothetical protein